MTVTIMTVTKWRITSMLMRLNNIMMCHKQTASKVTKSCKAVNRLQVFLASWLDEHCCMMHSGGWFAAKPNFVCHRLAKSTVAKPVFYRLADGCWLSGMQVYWHPINNVKSTEENWALTPISNWPLASTDSHHAFSPTPIQLSPRNCAKCYFSWNIVNCFKAVRNIAPEMACNRQMTLKVIQGHKK